MTHSQLLTSSCTAGHTCCELERKKEKVNKFVYCQLDKTIHKSTRQGCAGPHDHIYIFVSG